MIIRNKEQHNIIDGPSLSALIDSLRYAHDEHNRIYVTFTTDDGKKRLAYITGLEYESGTGSSLNLAGFIQDYIHKDGSFERQKDFVFHRFELHSSPDYGTCYYDAQKRIGNLEIVVDYVTPYSDH